MKTLIGIFIVPAFLWTGCGNRAPAPQANYQPQQQPGPAPAASAPDAVAPAENGAAMPVQAPSPFGSREVAAPPAPEVVSIPRGTTLRVRLAQSIDTARSRAGERFTATLDAPVLHGAHVAIPKGTTFTGHVTAAKPSGRLRGRAVLGLTLDAFEWNGKSYPIATSGVSRTSANHKRRNLGLIGGGSGVGALIGAIAGGGKGALIGAGAGAAAGTAGAAFTGRRNVRLPAESLLAFTLERPVQL